MWQVNQQRKLCLLIIIWWILISRLPLITFNPAIQARAGNGLSLLSVLWTMIFCLSLIPSGMEEVERFFFLQAFCSWAGIHGGEAQILCTQERKMDGRELEPCTLPVLRCTEGKLHLSIQIPKKLISAKSHSKICGAGNWPLIRDAEISLFRRALFQSMEFHGRWTGKTCQERFYRVGKCSKLYQKLFSVCQKLSAQCQRVAIWTSLIFLVLHCISWQVK